MVCSDPGFMGLLTIVGAAVASAAFVVAAWACIEGTGTAIRRALEWLNAE